MDVTSHENFSALTASEPGDLDAIAWVDLVRSADPSAIAAARLTVLEREGTTAVRSRAGGPLVNRAFGAPADPALIAILADFYKQEAVPLFFIQMRDRDRSRCEQVAAGAGLVPYRRRVVHLARQAGPVPPTRCALEIGAARAVDMLRAAELYCAAFDAESVFAPVIASLHGSPRWKFFVARAEGAPVALGMLFVDGERGYLMGGATVPRFRGLGVQAALIRARLELAGDLGCTRVEVQTGDDALGDPQHSFRNLMRLGFEVVARSDTYAPSGIVWTHGRRAGIR